MICSTCCTIRESPSSDSFPVRPTLVPQQVREGVSKVPLPIMSWSTASAFSKLEDAAELQAIFDEEPSGVHSTGDKLKAKNSSPALDILRSKLRKHLSRDSGVSRRKSDSLLAYGEGNIEEHKQHRSFRRTRIRVELSNDEIYDDDAKSLSSIDVSKTSPNSPYVADVGVDIDRTAIIKV